MAVGSGSEFFEPPDPPVAGRGAVEGEFERRLAVGAAEECGAGEQPPAQRRPLAPAELAESALQQPAPVVGWDRPMARRFRHPKTATAQPLDPARPAQFLAAVLKVGATMAASASPPMRRSDWTADR